MRGGTPAVYHEVMLKHSRMLALDTEAPKFSLADGSGRRFTLDEIAGLKPVLVAFICNHCPYVKHMARAFAQFAREYQAQGLAIVAVSPNDVASYPQDGPTYMVEFARENGFAFPYLYDDTQQVALAYGAVCTPDLFLFDGQRRLAYRGQFDASRPGSRAPVTGADLRAAADAVLAGKSVGAAQVPSAGCSIKWKAQNEPDWA
jgi:peroxiredoxin